MSNEYPKEPCKDHPKRMWEWDGYGWICIDCIFEPSPSEK